MNEKNTKVVIITWCNTSLNFGELLQGYALQKVVQKLGYKVSTISYLSQCCPLRYKMIKLMNYLQLPFNAEQTYETFIGRLKFYMFAKFYMSSVTQCYNRKNLINRTKDISILICGSDQIWNPNIFDSSYFLDFAGKSVKKIAYATSLAIENYPRRLERTMKKIGQMVSDIDYVSVRENSGKEILKKFTNKKIKVVLDPTLLLNEKQWNKLTAKRMVKDKYLFCYIVGDLEQQLNLIREIAKKVNVNKIICIRMLKNTDKHIEDIELLNSVGPSEFLSLIKYSEYICTDSFHGVAFCINYNKQFFSFRRYGFGRNFNGDMRIEDLLFRLGINEQMINDKQNLTQINKIDYKLVNEKLSQLRIESFRFLKNSLKNS